MFYKLRFFIPIAVAITGLAFLAFGEAQQTIRQSAYDPQIQISEDIAANLNLGASPRVIVGNRRIDISKSLATFIMIFDKNGKPTTSSALLSGKIPMPPSGVFAFTNQNGQDRITWQPADDVRIATIITSYNNGFVLAGRNMREAEARTQRLFYKTIEGWLVILAATFAATLIFIPEPKGKKK